MRMIPQPLLKGRVFRIFLSFLLCHWARLHMNSFLTAPVCIAIPCTVYGSRVFMCRWPGVPSHAPPTAAVYEEPQQRNANPPQELCDSVVAWGDLHTVLLHALPSDGVGEPQCGALQGYLTNREVRNNHHFLLYFIEKENNQLQFPDVYLHLTSYLSREQCFVFL